MQAPESARVSARASARAGIRARARAGAFQFLRKRSYVYHDRDRECFELIRKRVICELFCAWCERLLHNLRVF